MMARLTGVCALLVGLFCATGAYPCKTARPVSNLEMVREADAIVLAKAENYAITPTNPVTWSGFVPDSKIHFKVLEVVRGKLEGDHLILPGILVDTDDFNDHVSPYTLVRPDGRRGNCFATSYRSGAQFLLMLKRVSEGQLTVYWYALAPVNEQLHTASDPWLLWVREQVKGLGSKSGANQ
jgi:hypothetical protein